MLELPRSIQEIREELDRLIDNYADSPEHLAEQVGLITNLPAKYGASISLVNEKKPGELQFNCYQYSFGLADVEVVTEVLRRNGYIFPNREFVQHLIATRLREIAAKDAKDGDHVLYAGSQIEHAGRIAQGSVESKWGNGHLWRHGLFEIPLRYGDTLRVFQHISQADSINAFLHYPSITPAL